MEKERASTIGRRKPLRNVTNNAAKTPAATSAGCDFRINNWKKEATEEGEKNQKLLSLCFRLSALTHEVEELVTKAVTSQPNENQSRKQLDSFSIFLTDIISFLEPWVPKLKEIVKSDDNEEPNPPQTAARTIRRDLEIESMVSPSPLVSWKGNSKCDQGKQLFLLTPLPPSKTTSSKPIKPNKLPVEILPSISENTHNNVLQISQTPHRQLQAVPKSDRSFIIVTPLKQFPRTGRKCTPYRQPNAFSYSNSSSSESSEKLRLRHPELLGIMQPYFPPKGGTNVDSSRFKATVSIVEEVPHERNHESPMSLVKEKGESTLKKELWAKFEAASKVGFSVQPNGKKGFMDLLDEASSGKSSDF